MRRRYANLIFALFLVLGCSKVGSQQVGERSVPNEVEKIINMDISHVDPSSVPDGEYIGEFPFTSRFMYRVKVQVKSGMIADIEVLENGTENKYAQKGLGVIERILQEQSPEVDAISGATVTSKSLMKCVEKALEKAR